MSLPNCRNDHTAVLCLGAGSLLHFLHRSCCGEEAQWLAGRCWGHRSGRRRPHERRAAAQALPVSRRAPSLSLRSFCACLLVFTFQVFLLSRLRWFYLWVVCFCGGTLTLKWPCKKPIEKQVPAALIMRTDEAALLGLFMTFCLC